MTDKNKDIEQLINMLQSPKSSSRYDACELLRVAPAITPEAIIALQNAIKDPDASVADAAKRALTTQQQTPEPSPREQSVDPKQNSQIMAAKKAYGWLWRSPLLTVPTLIVLYFFSDSILFPILGSALWHLILLQYANNKKSGFVRWHGRQALVLAGIRTAIPLFFFFTDGEYFYEESIWPFLLLLAVYFIGNIWGRNQVLRGDCWLMRWRGHGEDLPLPTQIEDSKSDQPHAATLPMGSRMAVTEPLINK
jgi:hypothetical protein